MQKTYVKAEFRYECRHTVDIPMSSDGVIIGEPPEFCPRCTKAAAHEEARP